MSDDFSQKYFELIENRKSNPPRNEITELHHIIPVSLGGDDSPENLVELTLAEHFLAHYYLYYITEGDNQYKMAAALLLMSGMTKKTDDTLLEKAKNLTNAKELSENYQKIKSEFIINQSNKTKEYFDDPVYGEQRRKHNSDKTKEYFDDPVYGTSRRQLLSQHKKEYFNDPTNRQKKVNSNIEYWYDSELGKERRNKQSNKTKEYFSDPVYGEQRRKYNSDKTKEYFDDPVYGEQRRKDSSDKTKEYWNNPELGKERLNDASSRTKRKNTDELYRKRKSQGHKESWNDERKLQHSTSQRGSKASVARKIKINGKIYGCAEDAAKENDIRPGTIYSWIGKGKAEYADYNTKELLIKDSAPNLNKPKRIFSNTIDAAKYLDMKPVSISGWIRKGYAVWILDGVEQPYVKRGN